MRDYGQCSVLWFVTLYDAVDAANLCVSYIMTSQNEEAEELMRKIEKEEERQNFTDPEKQCFHLCIVNLGQYHIVK